MYSKYEQKIIDAMKKHYTWLTDGHLNALVDKKVEYRRKPTASEIRFGEGAAHYRDFDFFECIGANGKFKKRIKGNDGLIYTRG